MADTGNCKVPYFINGTPNSGLTLADTLYSDDGGTTYAYSASEDAEGADSVVTHLQSSMNGAFLAKTGAVAPSFELRFRVVVE